MYEQEKQFNKFSTLPFVPYNIVVELMKNDNLFKLLKYPTYDCLSKPNLTHKEKASMLWKNQDNQQDYNIFLTPLVENLVLDDRSILKIYRYDDTPNNAIKSVVCYSFDILYGGKTAIIDYEGVPCSRGDVIQMEILKSLNGTYIGGLIAPLQYNRPMSRNCHSQAGVNGSNRFTGTSLIMTTEISCLS